MTELLQLSFFRNAFFISLMLAVLFGILSFFVVLRRMSFLGAGIAHTAFGGVALGLFLGIHPFFTAVVFCLVAAIVIARLTGTGTISADTGIGIFFSFSMALGALFIALKKSYSFDLTGYLFGNILGVEKLDFFLVLGVMAIFIPFILFFFHRLLFLSFDRETAGISGIRRDALETSLLAFLALIIVISIKIVGIILISALIVLPASFGNLFFSHFRGVIVFSVLFTLFIMTGGLFLSYHLDTPAGATMVILGTILYFTALAIRPRRR